MNRLDYRIGRLVLQLHRQLLDDGEPVAIGRRALDLLSVLAAAQGALVTKDELVQQVWTGAFVEDNAIQAQIAAARKALGSEAGRLTTVRGIGYCLSAEPIELSATRACAEVSPTPITTRRLSAPPSRGKRHAMAIMAVGVAAVLLAATAGVLAWRKLQPSDFDTISLRPFDTTGQGSAARTLARNLVYRVGAALSGAGVSLVAPEGRDQGLVLTGAAEMSGSDLHVTTRLQDGSRLLWSTSFSRPVAQAEALQEQVAGKLADVLHCALDTRSYPGRRIDLATMRLYLRACDLEHEPDSAGQVRDLYRQIVDRQPKFSLAWSRLAYRNAMIAFELGPDQAAMARQEARRDAQTALRLDPHNGLAFEALADVGLGSLRFDQLYALFQRGLAGDPDNAKLLQDRGELLLRMGRVDDALADLRRASDLEPFSPDDRVDMMQAWVADGRIDLALDLARRGLIVWPDDPTLARRLFMIEARYGDPKKARAVLTSPAASSFRFSETEKQLSGLVLALREKHGGAAARALVASDLEAFRSGHNDLAHTMLDLSQAGALDEAFGAAAQFGASGPPAAKVLDPEFLWEPGTEALRRDPRFITLAAKLGVADFWRRTGKWPDFCATPSWPYDCKAVAAKPPPLGGRPAEAKAVG